MIPSKRTVVLTIVSLETGGAQVQLIALAKHLKSRGWLVIVCSILGMTPLADELREDDIEVRILNPGSRFRFNSVLSSFNRLLREVRPQALVGFAYHANILVKLCGARLGVPRRITSIRSVQFGGRFRDLLERFTFKLAHATVVNSYRAAELLEERRVIPSGKSLVIRNVVCSQRIEDADRFSPTLGGASEAHEFHWLAVGRLDPAKDYPALMRAVEQLKRAGEKFHLRIAGEGPCRAELISLLTELQLNDRVTLLGHLDCLADQFQWADAVVMSSWREGLPNALLEGMYWRKPIVSTDVGGIPDLVKDGTTGFLVPSRDPRALASGMKRLMDLPPESRKQMGQAAREFVSAEFDYDRIMRQWEDALSGAPERHLADAKEIPGRPLCIQ